MDKNGMILHFTSTGTLRMCFIKNAFYYEPYLLMHEHWPCHTLYILAAQDWVNFLSNLRVEKKPTWMRK